MGPYIILWIVPFILAFREVFYKEHSKNAYLWITLIFVVIVGGTNGNGPDWYAYENIQYTTFDFQELIQFEPLFILVYKICGNFHVFLFCMATICFAMVARTLKKESPYPFFSILFFISTYTLFCYMGILRQAFALTLIIYSWNYRDNRKIEFLFLLLAIGFHYSSAIALFYLLIPRNKIIGIKMALFGLVIGLAIRPILLSSLAYSMSVISNVVAGKLLLYLDSDGLTTFSFSYFLSMVLILLLMNVYMDKTERKDIFYYNAYIISIYVYLFLTFSPTFGRLVMYYGAVQINLAAIILYNCGAKFRNGKCSQSTYILLFCVLVTLSSYIYFGGLVSNFEGVYVPYKSILY